MVFSLRSTHGGKDSNGQVAEGYNGIRYVHTNLTRISSAKVVGLSEFDVYHEPYPWEFFSFI